MNLARRNYLIFGLVAAAWAVAVLWETAEHLRVRRAAWAALIARGKDISNTLGVIVRSQRRFAGFVSKESVEAALQSLVKPGEVAAIALLNEAGEVVASAGEFSDPEMRSASTGSFASFGRSVAVTNLIEVGAGAPFDPGQTNPVIVVPRPRFDGTNRPPGFDRDRDRDRIHDGTNPPPRPEERPGGGFGPPPEPGPGGTNDGFRGPPPWARRGDRRPSRPPWMSEDEFKALIQKKGVQRFAVLLSTESARSQCRDDLWLRCVIAVLASVAASGSAFAWGNLAKSADLQIRLVRASEMNLHLKELNLAAAGLAHETRNPLNIIRGLAQMIFKQEDVSAETRDRARSIVDEADRVTAQLTEFIHYSRPREVRLAPAPLREVISEVLRTLSCDLDEKRIRPSVSGDAMEVEADQQMLRQMIFNLVLNAVQAVPDGGAVAIAIRRLGGAEAALEIRDDGPGVPPELQNQIFKPYFTTKARGSGLGLAVVQKIAAAHGWEVSCESNHPAGAVFTVSHLRIAS